MALNPGKILSPHFLLRIKRLFHTTGNNDEPPRGPNNSNGGKKRQGWFSRSLESSVPGFEAGKDFPTSYIQRESIIFQLESNKRIICYEDEGNTEVKKLSR